MPRITFILLLYCWQIETCIPIKYAIKLVHTHSVTYIFKILLWASTSPLLCGWQVSISRYSWTTPFFLLTTLRKIQVRKYQGDLPPRITGQHQIIRFVTLLEVNGPLSLLTKFLDTFCSDRFPVRHSSHFSVLAWVIERLTNLSNNWNNHHLCRNPWK